MTLNRYVPVLAALGGLMLATAVVRQRLAGRRAGS